MCTLTNSEDPDKMPHNAAFHQCLHLMLRSKQSSGTEIQPCTALVLGVLSQKVNFIPILTHTFLSCSVELITCCLWKFISVSSYENKGSDMSAQVLLNGEKQ